MSLQKLSSKIVKKNRDLEITLWKSFPRNINHQYTWENEILYLRDRYHVIDESVYTHEGNLRFVLWLMSFMIHYREDSKTMNSICRQMIRVVKEFKLKLRFLEVAYNDLLYLREILP